MGTWFERELDARVVSAFRVNWASVVSRTSAASAVGKDSDPIPRFFPEKCRPSMLLDGVSDRVCWVRASINPAVVSERLTVED